jgi:lysozyme family protein
MNAPPPQGAGKLGAGALALTIAGILATVYANEGGYINHPNDPGGATNHGVTEKVARKHGYQGDMRQFQKHCSERHSVCADKVYTRDYIERPGYMPMVSIEPAVAEELVDTAVNMGPPRPSRWFQESINELLLTSPKIAVDGKVGPATIAAYRKAQSDWGRPRTCVLMLDKLDAKQRAEYDRLVRVNPRLKVFYKGWTNRRIENVNRADCLPHKRAWA